MAMDTADVVKDIHERDDVILCERRKAKGLLVGCAAAYRHLRKV